MSCHRDSSVLLLCDLHGCAQKDNPSHAEVDELHARVMEAVRQLYERHRELLPDHTDRHLVVV